MRRLFEGSSESGGAYSSKYFNPEDDGLLLKISHEIHSVYSLLYTSVMFLISALRLSQNFVFLYEKLNY